MKLVKKLSPLLLTLSLILAACSSVSPKVATPAPASSSSTTSDLPAPAATAGSVETSSLTPQTAESTDQPAAIEDLVRIDEQGAVVVEVTPVNLASPGELLEFEVALNTHSIDLSMDLAPLATLTTDSGKTVQASQWDAPMGGHHVSGRLIFPTTVDGQPVLNGANQLILTIKELDVPERVFTWDLSQ
jgi:hypothetical protein